MNPLKFSCTLLVNGLPPSGFRPGLPEVLPLMATPAPPPSEPAIDWDARDDAPAMAALAPLVGLTHPSIGSSSSNGFADWTDVEVNSGSKLATDSSDSTTGLNGGVTCLEARATQSTDLKNGWSLSSAASRVAPSRCFGFRLRSWEEKDSAGQQSVRQAATREKEMDGMD